MKDYQYLVTMYSSDWEDPRECPDGTVSKVMTAAEIFNYMDMADCFPYDFEMDIWRINGIGSQLTECAFFGTWHDPADPLKMCIVGGGIRETGWGTDH